MQNILKKIVLIPVLLGFLLISGVGLANDEQNVQLENAINTNNLKKAEKILNSGFDFKNFDYRYHFKISSKEMAKLLLNKGMDIERFVRTILNNMAYEQNNKKELVNLALDNGLTPNLLLQIAIAHQAMKEQNYFIELALSKGAKFSSIKRWDSYELPTPEAFETVLKNHNDANDVMFWVVSAVCYPIPLNPDEEPYRIENEEEIHARNSYVKRALDKGADPLILIKIIVTGRYKHTAVNGKIERPENLIAIASEYGANLSDLKKIRGAHCADISLGNAWLLLDKSYDPNEILNLAFAECYHHDKYDNDQTYIDYALAKIYQIVELALNAGANPNNIRYFATLPSVELSELLFKHGLNPEVFLDLIGQSAHITFDSKTKMPVLDKQFIQHREKLVELE